MKSLITRQHDEGWAVWRSGHICDSIAVQIGKKPQPANKLSRFKPGRDGGTVTIVSSPAPRKRDGKELRQSYPSNTAKVGQTGGF